MSENLTSAQLKVALIGAGGWGRQHARIFSSRPDTHLCAIVGRNPDKTAVRAKEYDATPYTDIAEMLEKERPDLVSVSLPNQAHFAPTLEVIEARFPLLVEKPLTFDLDEADTLIAEAQRRGLFFAINFNHRYAVPVQKAKAAIEGGQLGRLTFATWRFGGDGASDHPHANLIETQCHGFDMLEFLCGPITHVSAEMTDITGGGFRTLALNLRFASGAIGQMLGTYDSSYGYPDTQRIEVDGTRGRTVVSDTVRRFEFQASGSEQREVWEAGYFNDRDRQFHLTFDAHVDVLLHHLRDGLPPPVPAQAGRRAVLLAHAAIHSWETGRRVSVEEYDAHAKAGRTRFTNELD